MGAAVPIFSGIAAPAAIVTGPAGCVANSMNPAGLIGGVGSGLAGAYGYDIYQVTSAKAAANDTINNVCSALPD